MADWKDRRVLIAGGSAGFGKALALRALALGAETFVGARDPNRLKAFESDVLAAFPSGRLHIRSVDALDPASLWSWFDEPEIAHEGLDVVISVVGKSERGNVLDLSAERFEEAFRVNVISTLLVAQRAQEALAKRKGTFVAIGSLASKLTAPYLGAYPPAKFALAGLVQQLRWEFEPLGVRTLFVAPGPIARDDAGQRYADQAEHLPDAAKQAGGGAPVKPIPPDELAAKVFLAIERGDLELVVPGKAKWLAAIWQVAPGFAKSILARRLKRDGG